jgi:hypothetical protein
VFENRLPYLGYKIKTVALREQSLLYHVHMANKQIPLEDRRLVVQRLANGQSTRQAIEGTAISSNQTAARIAKQESHAIAQHRQDYLQKLEAYELTSMDMRVKQLGSMVVAHKTIKVTVPPTNDGFRPLGKRDFFIEVEDWQTRLKAIQYIDKIENGIGLGGLQLNVVQQVNNR